MSMLFQPPSSTGAEAIDTLYRGTLGGMARRVGMARRSRYASLAALARQEGWLTT